MPTLDQLFKPTGPESLPGAQCWEAQVVAVTSKGVYVVLPKYDRRLKWGPVMPVSLSAKVGDRLSVALSDAGIPWALGAGGGGGDSGGGNIDGGEPDSVYGGTTPIDGGEVS